MSFGQGTRTALCLFVEVEEARTEMNIYYKAYAVIGQITKTVLALNKPTSPRCKFLSSPQSEMLY